TNLRHLDRPPILGPIHYLEDVGDHFTRALEQNRVAFGDIKALDLVEIVEGRTADGDAPDVHWLDHRERRQRARSPDCENDGIYNRGFLPRRILERDRPARRFRSVAGLLLQGYLVDFHHDAIDLIGQPGPPGVPGVAVFLDLVDRTAQVPILG